MTNNGIDKNAPRPRLCHLRRWPDFVGYGFNLHCQNTKPGQFIGKVDPNSPADSAGLRENDRIIEVNYVSVRNDKHQQVVARIKEGVSRNGTNYPEEVILLVVDQETDEYYKEKECVIRSSDPNVEKLETENRDGSENDDDSPHLSNRSINRADSSPAREPSPPTNLTESKRDYRNVYDSPESTVIPTKKTSSPAISRASATDDEYRVEHGTYDRHSPPISNRNLPREVPATNTYANIDSPTKSSPRQNSYGTSSSQSPASANGSNGMINLNMSAAEYREQLKAQNSRKRDPRQNQQMSMKEKRDLIERL